MRSMFDHGWLFPPRGGGFNPLDLGPSLLAWWDASQGVTLVGSQVSAWADRKNGLTVTQAISASRPTFSPTSFNGAPGLTFDGADDYLRVESTGLLPVGSDGAETWAVIQQDANDSLVHLIMSYGGFIGPNVRYFGISNEKPFVLAGDGTGYPSITGVAYSDLLSRHVIRNRFTATDIYTGADGGAEATRACVPATAALRTTIGATMATATYFWNGILPHLLVTLPLPTDQAAQLQTYLMARRML